MKGYLQRIAENVIDPGKSVQPALRPIFSAPTFTENVGAFVSEETVTSAGPIDPLLPRTVQERFALTPRPDPILAPNREIPPSTRAIVESLVSASDVASLQSAKPANVSSDSNPAAAKAEIPIQQLVSRPQAKKKESAPLDVGPISDVTTPGSPDAPRHVKTRPDLVSSGPEPEWNQIIRATPLVPINSRQNDTRDIVPSTRNRLTANDEGTNKQSRGLLGRNETESDDIQIHIGRIEVVALPPAAPRPSTRSIPKPLDLEEYLKRSDRRAL